MDICVIITTANENKIEYITHFIGSGFAHGGGYISSYSLTLTNAGLNENSNIHTVEKTENDRQVKVNVIFYFNTIFLSVMLHHHHHHFS